MDVFSFQCWFRIKKERARDESDIKPEDIHQMQVHGIHVVRLNFSFMICYLNLSLLTVAAAFICSSVSYV